MTSDAEMRTSCNVLDEDFAMTLLRILFSAQGRLSRMPHFLTSLGVFAVMVVLSVVPLRVSAALGGFGAAPVATVLLVCSAVVVIIGGMIAECTLGIRRLHDIGVSGWHLLWVMGINLAGSAVNEESPHSAVAVLFNIGSVLPFVWMLVWPGQPVANRFGPPPGAPQHALPD